MASLKNLLFTTLLSSFALASVLPHQELHNRDTCQRGQRTINGQLYTISCGTDHPGNDYKAAPYSTFEGCIQACAADPNCVTAQYTHDTKFCYFKNRLNWGSLTSNVDSVVRGDDCVFGENHAFGNNRTCNQACGIDRPGGDYNLAQLPSFEACIESCAYDTRCVSAQYDVNTGFCYYKNQVTDAVVKSNVDTILCFNSDPDKRSSSSSSSSSSTTTTTKTPPPATTTTAIPTTTTTTASSPATCSPQPSYRPDPSSTCSWQISCGAFYLDGSAIEEGNSCTSYECCAAVAQQDGGRYFTWVSYEKVPGYRSGCRVFTGSAPPSQATYIAGAAFGAANTNSECKFFN